MSDTPETLTNIPQAQPSADLETVFSHIQEELETQTQRSLEQKNSLNDSLREREQTVEDCLARARNHYVKKEWTRAFAEWDKICALLPDQDEFRKKVTALKESHENLVRVNREIAEIKGVLSQRSSPSTADRKFVQEAHAQTSGQVKNVYAYLSQQLRTERTPKTLSFWWPVLLAVVLLAAGGAGLSARANRAHREWMRNVEESGQVSRVELAAVQTERDRFSKTVEEQKNNYETKIEELKQQNEGWRNAGRDKISDLEVQVKQLDTENNDLKKKVETLIQENLKR